MGSQELDQEASIMIIYRETPYSEDFNIDPDLKEIIHKNRQIIKRSTPRFKTHPLTSTSIKSNHQLDRPSNSSSSTSTSTSSSTSPLAFINDQGKDDHDDDDDEGEDEDDDDSQTSLIHIIARTELTKLGRLTESERLYFNEFNRTLRSKYSSSCQYLNQRLKFRHQDQKSNLTHFSSNPSLFKEPFDFRVIRNEWPYSIPHDYQHMIVWSRLPLVDPGLAKSREELKMAYDRGLSGFENLTQDFLDLLNRFHLNEGNKFRVHSEDESVTKRGSELGGGREEIQSNHGSRPSSFSSSSSTLTSSSPSILSSSSTQILNNKKHDHHQSEISLDHEIRQFIRDRWKFKDGFINLFWFLNPVSLQSCPELPHFHVFVKKI